MDHRLPHRISRMSGARTPDGAVVDVELGHDGRHAIVTAVRPSTSQRPRENLETLDLTGFVLLTAPAEPHAHLDKALSWDALAPPDADLATAIDVWRRGSPELDEESFHRRATAAALALLRNGTTAIRTHADILFGPDPLRGIRAVDRVRRELRGLVDIEIVALAPPGADIAMLDAALTAGADLLGGAPHLAPDPASELARLLDFAESRGVGTDLHVDEFLRGDHHTLAQYARRATAWPPDRTCTAGHCCRLGTLPAHELAPVLALLADAGMGIVSLPLTNLYLQGRDEPIATPRGLTALAALLEAGIPVAAGADNVRDPFNPLGRSDALETAALLIAAGHVPPRTAVHLVTDGAREVLGLPEAGAKPGARAEFLAVRGTGLLDVIATAPADRIVIRDGTIVSIGRTEYLTADVAPLEV